MAQTVGRGTYKGLIVLMRPPDLAGTHLLLIKSPRGWSNVLLFGAVRETVRAEWDMAERK